MQRRCAGRPDHFRLGFGTLPQCRVLALQGPLQSVGKVPFVLLTNRFHPDSWVARPQPRPAGLCDLCTSREKAPRRPTASVWKLKDKNDKNRKSKSKQPSEVNVLRDWACVWPGGGPGQLCSDSAVQVCVTTLVECGPGGGGPSLLDEPGAAVCHGKVCSCWEI